ncbi:enolase C-terminal domain-like protein [Streptomyces sp. LHD-70]|uniref:enolase C-terminal domain-like protein n=1 Tax=Streptomyces sp. LHD-70 TaxID=3072140 RepID=UPI00280CDFC0|nr:enolase C-terminal domain-like protein [Streptomyces sp. LHD-70]MDQ8708051.1 enolase C-terminal domain-like protein [Streptomyces sp. LHD-70]
MPAAPESATADVRIADVRLTPVLIADPPLLNVQGVHQPYVPRLIVEVVTEGGVVGVGETLGDTNYLDIARQLAPLVKGRRTTETNLLPALAAGGAEVDLGALSSPTDIAGMRGTQTADKLRLSVISAFEVAMLDALGKVTGLPVHALLGGKVRDTVEYSGYLFYRWAEHPQGAGAPEDAPRDDWGAALDPAGIVEQARRMRRDHGFTSFKLKGGVFPPDQEAAAIRALAEAFPDSPLRLDPNGGWSVGTSLKVAAQLADVLEYLEDPTAGTPGMAEVAAGTGMPLATNMCVTRLGEIPEAFTRGAVQVVLSDHHYWGGLRATKELAAICATFGVGVSMHSNTHLGISLAAMTHVAATVPSLDYACDTHRPWQTDDVITEPHVFRDGRVEVSDAPGLGVELDRTALAALHERWQRMPGMRDRDDEAGMRLADPTWTPHNSPRW